MNIKPEEIEFKNPGDNNSGGPLIFSLSQELLADLDTPVSAFYKICNNNPYSFLLESVEGNEKLGRYSIIGTEPVLIFTNKGNKTLLENKTEGSIKELNSNPFLALKTLLQEFDLAAGDCNNFLGFVGYFGYENIRWIEPKTKFKAHEILPDVCLTLPGKLVIFDHILHKVSLISVGLARDTDDIKNKLPQVKLKLDSLLDSFKKSTSLPPLSLNYKSTNLAAYKSNYTKDEYIKMVIKAKEYVKKGDIFQVVPSQKLIVTGSHNGLTLYRALRSINPSPYLFYLNFPDFEIAGSSPEVMVKCEIKNSKRVASLRPIAGTYPRGKNDLEDLKNISTLQNDPKERAEHLMLVDLARNDLGRVCEAGSINVPELMVIEKYSHVLHMVSLVEGILKDGKSSIDLLCASFPAGTLSGAPKVRALEIINELEKNQRGPYGGCTGFFGLNNTINTCMTIRTFVVHKDFLEIQAGGGIVADSDSENEYQETLRKGAALLKAISLVS